MYNTTRSILVCTANTYFLLSAQFCNGFIDSEVGSFPICSDGLKGWPGAGHRAVAEPHAAARCGTPTNAAQSASPAGRYCQRTDSRLLVNVEERFCECVWLGARNTIRKSRSHWCVLGLITEGNVTSLRHILPSKAKTYTYHTQKSFVVFKIMCIMWLLLQLVLEVLKNRHVGRVRFPSECWVIRLLEALDRHIDYFDILTTYTLQSQWVANVIRVSISGHYAIAIQVNGTC